MENLKQFLKENQSDTILFAGVLLISLISFGAGRMTVPLGTIPEPIIIETSNTQPLITDTAKKIELGNLVASVNGTRYYIPSCSGVNRIKEENKIWFQSVEEAENLGYTPARNCPGL